MNDRMLELDVMPLRLDRSTGALQGDPQSARVLEGVDICWQTGTLRRGPGYVHSKIQGSTYTVTNCAIIERHDGRRIVIDSNTNGDIRITVPSGLPGCASSLAEAEDGDIFTGTAGDESFEEGPDNGRGGGGTDINEVTPGGGY